MLKVMTKLATRYEHLLTNHGIANRVCGMRWFFNQHMGPGDDQLVI